MDLWNIINDDDDDVYESSGLKLSEKLWTFSPFLLSTHISQTFRGSVYLTNILCSQQCRTCSPSDHDIHFTQTG